MSYRRERASKASLLDGLEEGGLRASSSYSDVSDHDNDKAVQSLQDRVVFLKREQSKGVQNFLQRTCAVCSMKYVQLTGDIHEEVESHNRLLDRMGNDMDTSRGIMSGTMARFKTVFEKKSSRRMCVLVGYFVAFFLIIYFLFRVRSLFIHG